MEIVRGDTVNFNVTVSTEAGVVFDLTGYTMTVTVKKDDSESDANAAIQKDATISSPLTGVGAFNLLPTETEIPPGDYIYDVQISDGASNVYTVVKAADFIVEGDVTRDI